MLGHEDEQRTVVEVGRGWRSMSSILISGLPGLFGTVTVSHTLIHQSTRPTALIFSSPLCPNEIHAYVNVAHT